MLYMAVMSFFCKLLHYSYTTIHKQNSYKLFTVYEAYVFHASLLGILHITATGLKDVNVGGFTLFNFNTIIPLHQNPILGP